MSKCNQFLLLLWKNWTLQKRGVLKTIFEIGLPLFFILILVLLRVTKIKVEQEKADSYNAFDIAVLPNGLEKYQHLAFTPNNTDIAEVVSAASSKLKLRAPKGFPSELEMVNFLSSSFAKNKNNSGFLGGIVFDTKNLTNPHITYKIRLSSRERNSKKQKANLFKDGSTSWHTKFMFPQFQKPGPREDKSIHGGPPGYYDEGFLTVQLAVDTALMEYKTKNASTNVVISIRRFPYPAYIKDPFILVIQQSFPVLLMLSLLFTALNIVRSVVHEKERKLKESMKMMGLSGWLHWTAWFCKYLLYLLITMVIATILCTVKFNSNGRVLNKSDPSLIFVILLLYSISSIMFCFCVSVFFSKANLAGAAGGIIWYLSYVPYYFISQSYENMNLAEKLVSCLLSNVAMGMGAQLVGKFEGIGTGVQWSNITKGVSVDDSLSLGLVLLMFLVDSILYGIITWYVETVFPGDYGVPRPWYFPVLPSYWCGTSTKVEVEDESPLMNGSSKSYGAVWDVVDADSFFEKDPIGLNAGVRMNNLKKVFSTEKGKKIAVNGVSLNLYDGQITALLGHNGAGKTTLLSMLTGLFPPTSGSAAVNGYDIVKDITSVRQSLGICPQHNVLFDSLTVEEHLWFFAKLKGCPSHKVSVQVEQMIHAVGLNDKRHTQARALSGGMKRKLSVGIAFIADSKIVMLDEPTSGMDPSARRFTWDLIQQQRAGRTILLTTHFMDEADLLGDRIAIMAEGTVKCCGTPLFLKKKYGVGYHMIMVKEPGCDIGRITNVVTKHIPTAQLESNVGAELSYILPHEATGKFEELFTELETQKDDLRIASYGASVTTMEEVFLKVGEGMDSTLRSKVTRENFPENQQTKDDVYSSENARLGTFGSEVSIGPSTNYKHNTGMALNLQRWKAMFVKKFLHSKRHKVSILFQLLLPLLFTLIALVNAKSFPKPTDSPPLVLVPDRFGSNVIPVRISAKTSIAKAHEFYQEYVKQFEGKVSQTVHVTDTEDMQSYLLRKARSDGVGYFNRRDLLAANFYQHGDIVNITAWFNNQPYHAIAISLAAVQNAVFRVMVGSDQSLTTINHPLPRSAQDKINDLSRNATGFLISFTLLFSMAFLSSSFILFLVQERSNKAKHVQLVSGVDPISYWTSAYLWDMINFMIPSCTLLILFVAFDVPAYRGVRLGYVFLVMVMYGWGVIPLMYLFSFVFKTPSTAFVILAMFNILTGLATLMTVNILSIPQLKLLDVANALKWAFLVLPNYCLGQGLSDIFNNYNSISFYNKYLNMCMRYLPHNAKICDKYIRKHFGASLQFQTNYLAWENPGVGRYLVFLAIEGVVIFLIVLVIEYGVFRILWSAVFRGINKNYHAFDKSLPEDDDVKAERTRILSGQLLPDVLVIKELTKVFNSSYCRCLSAPSASLVAVDHLSLGISQGECFGLLGINGAGKTTTFRMLTGDESTTSGTAILDSNDIHQNMNKVRQRLGYCPQFDALIGEMTGRELLFMYARLRGVPEALIPEVSENLIQMLLLQDHADKVSKSYSGGNKRKLSTAISLVGDPPVVFLDEPTTGMDPVARRLLWDALSKVRAEGRSIVITSHSMDECEALCTRLAIMVNGRFKCLGSTQHLKTKFGQGYTLLAKVGPMSHTNMLADTRPLKEFIEGSFPGSILKDEHEGMVHYHICDPRISWAQIFGVIERNKLNYCIEDYSVSQTTLEQVFLNFARSQRETEE